MTIKPSIRWEELNRKCWDVVVIGAGPAGALAAQQMAILGGRVLLVDRKACPRWKVCGACLSQRTLKILDAVGLKATVCGLGGRALHEFRVSAASGKLTLSIPEGLAVSRSDFDAALVQAAIDAGAAFVPKTTAAVAASTGDARWVALQPNAGIFNAALSVQGRVVLAADGLGHPCLAALPEFSHQSNVGSLIGAGCEVTAEEDDFPAGVIHMGIGRHGYVGMVVVKSGVLNVAAAIIPQFVRESGGLGPAAVEIMREAKLPELRALQMADWQGTPALTRSADRIAAERIFLIGDAAGYIEPFTGEGIAWALTTGVQVAPLAQAGWSRWERALESAWTQKYAQSVGRQQQLCRALARGLRSPWCVAAAMTGLARMPWIAPKFIHWAHAPIPIDVATPPRSLARTPDSSMDFVASMGLVQAAIEPCKHEISASGLGFRGL